MKVTANEVAKLAGVSKTTVSLVLNENTDVTISEPTKKRVVEAAKKLEYGPFAPNKMLPSAQDFVAVMLPTLSNPFYPEALNIITSFLSEYGYQTLINCSDKNVKKEKDFLEKLDKRSVKMLIYTYTPQAREAARKVAKNIPICVLGELDFSLDCLHVALDSVNAGYIVIKHLWNTGRRKICFISNSLNTLSHSRKKRLDGMLKFLEEQNSKDNLIVAVSEEEHDEYQTGYTQTKNVLASHPDIDAIIGVNDFTAIGAINAIRDFGLETLGKIAVVGFDNTMLARHYTPRLTSVEHHIYDRVKLAITTLLDDKRKSHSNKIIYEPSLIVRESSE